MKGRTLCHFLLFCLALLAKNSLSQSIVSTSPTPNAMNVSASTQVSVTFGKMVDISSVVDSCLYIHGSQRGKYAGKLVPAPELQTITFSPDEKFQRGEIVTVIVTSAVRDTNGLKIGRPYVWSFIIESAVSGANFNSREEIAPLNGIETIQPGDFDNDGDIDLAMTGWSTTKLSIFFNNGNGSFAPEVSYFNPSSSSSIAVADFDMDGDLDLAIGYQNQFAILKNDGHGSFAERTTLQESGNIGLAKGDIDGDGDFDLLTYAESRIGIYNNNGNASFDKGAVYPTTWIPRNVFVHDFDGDHDFDILFTIFNQTSINILLNSGNGEFPEQLNYPVSENAGNLNVADFNNDGHLDIATHFEILLNNGGGRFNKKIQVPQVGAQDLGASGDFDGDGDVDLLLPAYDRCFVLFNDSRGFFTQNTTFSLPRSESPRFAAADYDNDGDIDLMLAGYRINLFSLKNNQSAAMIRLSSSSIDFEAVEVDSMRVREIVIYNDHPQEVLVIRQINSASPVFIPGVSSGAIVPGDSLVVPFQFAPQSMSSYADYITFESNDPTNPNLTLYATGNGIPIRWVTPSPNAVLSAETPEIIVAFSEAMDAASLHQNSFVVQSSQTGTIKGAYLYDAGSSTCSFQPERAFRAGEKIHVTLTTDVENSSGIRMPDYYSWSFIARVRGGSGSFVIKKGPAFSSPLSRVATADFDRDDDLDLVVTTGYPDYGIRILRNDGRAYFVEIARYYVFDATSLSTGDFDRDGDIDIAVTSYYGVSLFYNDGTGSFETKIFSTGQSSPHSMVASDIDGDSYLDLIVVAIQHLSILVNRRDGTFIRNNDYSFGTGFAVASADNDNDGDQDLTSCDDDYVSVFLNNRNHTYLRKFMPRRASNSFEMISADFDNDGFSDLAITGESPDIISVLRNDGTGYYENPVNYGTSAPPFDLTCGDFDADGDLDLVTAYGQYQDMNVSLLFNDGSGRFTLREVHRAQINAHAISAGDFDQDGDLDLIAIGGQMGMRILLNRNRATDVAISVDSLDFDFVRIDSVRSIPFWIYNHGLDSTLYVHDIHATNAAFGVEPRQVAVPAGDSARIELLFRPAEMRGYADSLFIRSNDRNLPVMTILLSGIGIPILKNTPPNNMNGVAANTKIYAEFKFDIDELTISDSTFVVHASQSGLVGGQYHHSANRVEFSPDKLFKPGEMVTVTLTRGIRLTQGDSLQYPYVWSFTIRGGGTGYFYGGVDYPVYNHPIAITSADFNNDGFVDIAVAHIGTGTVSILPNKGDGTFDDKLDFNTNTEPTALAAGDFDKDGDSDLVIGNNWDDYVLVLFNDGTGRIDASVQYYLGDEPHKVFAADLTGSGALDLIIVDRDESAAFFMLNDGKGKFSSIVRHATGWRPYGVLAADFNRNGNMDIAVTTWELFQSSEYPISFYKNDGLGNFEIMSHEPETPRIINLPSAIAATDLNRDGYPDLLVTDNDNIKKNMTVLMNQKDGNFKATQTYSVDGNPTHIVSADFDGDADMDAAVVNEADLHVFLNNGDGIFGAATIYSTGGRPVEISCADYNNDGALDLAVVNYESNSISVLFNGKPTAVDLQDNPSMPDRFELGSNHPNPFNHSTRIRYALPEASQVTMTVYNLLGREVIRLCDNENTGAGYHSLTWDGTDSNGTVVASGVYILKMTATGKNKRQTFSASTRMLLMK